MKTKCLKSEDDFQNQMWLKGPDEKTKHVVCVCVCTCVRFKKKSWLESSQEIHKPCCHWLIFTACLNVYFWSVYSVSSLHRVM